MKSLKIVYALFTITFSTILLELLYTRVFSVVYISSFAFLMISLALFGYGLSGVMMSLTRLAQRPNAIRYLETALLGNALILPIVYKFTLTFTVDFLHLFNPISNIFLLILNLLFLILPYFLAGTSLVLIFSLYSKEIGKLYFIDLAGSALGGLAIVPLITTWGPSKVVSIVYLLLFLCWFILSHLPRKAKVAIFAAGILVFGALFHYSETLYPVVPRMVKRAYLLHQETKQFEYSRWSPINKIDVAPFIYDWKKIIWIDGGTMQSWLVQASRNIKEEGVIQEGFEAIPYRLGKKGSALIIGSAGGYEVLCGLTNGFKRIVAVEMDPEICHIVERKYAPYIGNLFQQRGVVSDVQVLGFRMLVGLKQKLKIKALRGLHGHERVARQSSCNQTMRNGLYGVCYRQGRDCSLRARLKGSADGAYQLGADKRAGRIMNKHMTRISGQHGQPMTHGVLA